MRNFEHILLKTLKVYVTFDMKEYKMSNIMLESIRISSILGWMRKIEEKKYLFVIQNLINKKNVIIQLKYEECTYW